MPGLTNRVVSANLLAVGAELPVSQTSDGLVLSLPAVAPDALSSTILLKVADRVQIVESRVRQGKDGVLRLEAMDAELVGKQIRAESMGGIPNIGFWSDADDCAAWQLVIERGGEFDVRATLAGEADCAFVVEIGG